MASPIESRLLAALVELAPQLGAELHICHGWRSFSEQPVDHADDASYRAACDPPIAKVVVFPQALLDGYRVDFFASLHRAYFGQTLVNWVAVECDGHDWHERTPQQAAYDRARDRALLRNGVITIRFTGSEINRDANQCAREAIDSLRCMSNRDGKLLGEHAYSIARRALDTALAEASDSARATATGND